MGDNSCLQHSNNMLSTIVVVCFMVASALGLEVINDQEMELVAIEEFLDLELAGKTAEDYFKENDVDGNGCFDFSKQSTGFDKTHQLIWSKSLVILILTRVNTKKIACWKPQH